MAVDYQATSSRPHSTDEDTRVQEYPTTSAAIEEKRTLLDELLPVPVTEHHSANSQTSINKALRRIISLGIIVVFLLTMGFYGTTLINDESMGKSSLKSVVGGLVNSLGGSVKGVQDEVSEGLEGLKLGGGNDTTSAGVWDDAPLSEITVQPMNMAETDVTTTSHPDWAKYTFLRTLPPSALPLEKPKKRIIFVGDIHGSLRPLKKLMKKLSYDPSLDLIIHVGDITAKGPDSGRVVEYLRTNRAKGVRGNHDEKVIEWRTWMRWAGKGYQSASSSRRDSEQKGWRAFIDDLDAQFPPNSQDAELSPEQQKQLEASLAVKAKSFPKGWTWRSEHWRIARGLAKEDYQYLVDLPLTLHLPSIHTIVVHAGLLARDPTKKATAEDQPYAAAIAASADSTDSETTRTQSEVALLQAIPQNRDPYTLLNIRSVLKDGEVTKKANKGTPWSEIWHEEMSRCTGAGSELSEKEEEETGSTDLDEDIERTEENERRVVERKKGSKTLPKMDCSPVTVIYGHAAGRGLDIKKYSKGLDSGCVYGKQLTALVLGDVKSTRDIKGAKSVRVGSKKGVLIDIECDKATGGKPE